MKLTSNDISLPLDENNLVYKAASLIFEEITFHFPPLITIHINKKIPMAAGLAGGSADAAATLIGMNDFFELNLSQDQLLEKAASIGADVPFCLLGGTALAEGKGEKLTKINGLQGFTIVLSKPDISVSTPWAYALYDEESPSLNIDKPNIDSLLLELNKQSYLNKINKSNISEVIFDESKFARSSFPNSNLTESCLSKSELTESSLAESALDTISKNMINVFEPIVSNSRLEIKETIELFKSFNPFKTMMSGSGPTVFSLFINKSDAKEAYDKLKEINKETYIFEMEEF